MRFWRMLVWSALALGCPAETLRGKLTQSPGKPPAAITAEGKRIELDGDQETRGVLADKRLDGFDLQAQGRFTAPARFQVDPIHTRAVLVFKDGRARLVTYWCDTCSIRTYTPGTCWCCEKETTLDLREPNDGLK